MELVRTRTQERGCEQLFYGIGVDSRRLKGERERPKTTWRGTFTFLQGGNRQQGGLGGQCDGLMPLLAHQAMIIMMIMIKQTVDEIEEKYEKGD